MLHQNILPNYLQLPVVSHQFYCTTYQNLCKFKIRQKHDTKKLSLIVQILKRVFERDKFENKKIPKSYKDIPHKIKLDVEKKITKNDYSK